VLSYRDGDIAPKVKDLTQGSGVDVVFDPVGGTLGNQAIQCLARHGRFGLMGYPHTVRAACPSRPQAVEGPVSENSTPRIIC
jgi:NADPH:quinone reductase-like Zn-dependent oxidoreductase